MHQEDSHDRAFDTRDRGKVWGAGLSPGDNSICLSVSTGTEILSCVHPQSGGGYKVKYLNKDT